MSLTLNEYQQETAKTAHYPSEHKGAYPILGLVGEAGELANKWKKRWRGDADAPTDEQVLQELGDVLWYVAAIARDLDTELETVARTNIEKTHGRAKRGTLHGTGDER